MRAFLIFLMLAGCTTTRYVSVSAPLDCPDPLALEKANPVIKAKINDMKKNDKQLYEYFYYRSKAQIDRRATLQNICRSTHER